MAGHSGCNSTVTARDLSLQVSFSLWHFIWNLGMMLVCNFSLNSCLKALHKLRAKIGSRWAYLDKRLQMRCEIEKLQQECHYDTSIFDDIRIDHIIYHIHAFVKHCQSTQKLLIAAIALENPPTVCTFPLFLARTGTRRSARLNSFVKRSGRHATAIPRMWTSCGSLRMCQEMSRRCGSLVSSIHIRKEDFLVIMGPGGRTAGWN